MKQRIGQYYSASLIFVVGVDQIIPVITGFTQRAVSSFTLHPVGFFALPLYIRCRIKPHDKRRQSPCSIYSKTKKEAERESPFLF